MKFCCSRVLSLKPLPTSSHHAVNGFLVNVLGDYFWTEILSCRGICLWEVRIPPPLATCLTIFYCIWQGLSWGEGERKPTVENCRFQKTAFKSKRPTFFLAQCLFILLTLPTEQGFYSSYGFIQRLKRVT